ncbi:MAG: YegS/Rv2252/BmrU family lipid kinase, partial [Polyangiaceae bacterium]|nr:YegS/Rv2252/BmrU family lipid kinase [Polyangiaceae bacterium]
SRIARDSFNDGVDIIAVVGGDGTLNEVVQAYLDPRGEPRPGPDLGVIPIGTGCDFKRSIGLSGDIQEAVHRLRDTTPRSLDMGVMELVDFQDRPCVRAYINITSFGMGGVADRLVNETPKWLGGKACFFVGSFRAMLKYRNAHVRVRVDGDVLIDGPIFNVAMANGRYFGGGMMIAPDADLSDGQLDVVCLGDLSRTEAIALSSKIYRGGHVGLSKVSVARGRVVEADPMRPREEVLLDMDGETPGKLPIRVRAVQGHLRVRA